MKIVIFSDNFYPELSGITDSLVLFGDELASRGHNILFVAPKYSSKDYARTGVPVGERMTSKKISVKRVRSFIYKSSPTGQGRIVFPHLSSLNAVRKFKPDIIHTNSPFGTGMEALFVSRLLNIPMVGTNHTPPSEFMAYSPINTKWFEVFTNRFFSWYYNRCLFVTSASDSLLKEMTTFGLKVKHRAIPNPINLNNFGPVQNSEEKLELKKKFKLSPNTILYAGRLAEEKRVDVIVRAVARLKEIIPDISLAITGHGVAEGALKKLAQELGIENRVSFFGFVPDETYPLIYKACDIFSIMSTAETQSLSLMQAMATGIPVVVADARALPEYVTSESGYVVPVGDDKTLADRFEQILTDTSLREKLGKGGQERVKAFSPALIIAEWEVVYRNAIK